MSCDSHRYYLVCSDMVMIERVLAHPDLRQSSGSALRCDAANFLIRKFQEGMTEEGALTVALDRYLRILLAWRSRPHAIDGYSHAQDRYWSGQHSSMASRPTRVQQPNAESPVKVISDLLGAATKLGTLTDLERAKLLQRAAACIDDCHRRLNWPISQTIDPDGCDIAFDLAAMASAVDCSTPQR